MKGLRAGHSCFAKLFSARREGTGKKVPDGAAAEFLTRAFLQRFGIRDLDRLFIRVGENLIEDHSYVVAGDFAKSGERADGVLIVIQNGDVHRAGDFSTDSTEGCLWPGAARESSSDRRGCPRVRRPREPCWC